MYLRLEKEFEEPLSAKMSAAILISMLPQDFKDMVFESQGASEISYEFIRDRVLAVAGSRINASQPFPMDAGDMSLNRPIKGEEANTWGEELKTGDTDAIREVAKEAFNAVVMVGLGT